MKKILNLSVIIPVYNEENTILKILNKINRIEINKEIIIVSDGSTDKTNLILKKNQGHYDKLICLDKNMGKGFACRQGITLAKGKYLIIQDADLEYNPENYYDLLDKLNDNQLVVYGSRVLKGSNNIAPPGLRPYFSKLANFILTKLSNLLNNQNLTDAHTCYKIFETKLIQSIDLRENGFGFCPEITAKISKLGIKIQETNIDYFGRNYDQGKKIRLIHAFEAFYVLLKYNFPYKNKLNKFEKYNQKNINFNK